MIIKPKELRSRGVTKGIATGIAVGIVTNSLIVGVCAGLTVRYKIDGPRKHAHNSAL